MPPDPAPSLDFSSLGELSVINDPAREHGHLSPSDVMYPGGPALDGGLPAFGDPIPENAGPGGRRPEWLKVRIGAGESWRMRPTTAELSTPPESRAPTGTSATIRSLTDSSSASRSSAGAMGRGAASGVQ